MWENIARKLRENLKGWSLNYVWLYRKHKNFFVEKIDEIDNESEQLGLTTEKYRIRKELNDLLNMIYKEEGIVWFQRVKEREMLEGDALTSYFMSKSTSRRKQILGS
jgi:hypothetical protein